MLMDGVLKSGCQSRYKQKLEPVGMLLSCVPYMESNSHRDMSLWPRKELAWYPQTNELGKSMGIFFFKELARIPRSSCFHASSSKPTISSSLLST